MGASCGSGRALISVDQTCGGDSKMWKLAIAVAFGLSLSAGGALAAPVTWTVPATTLPDGAVVKGTFVYDTSTLTISNVNIAQTVVRPGTYTHLANFPFNYRGGQRTASVALNDETWWVNTASIPAAGGSFVATIGTGQCVAATAGVCENAYTTNYSTALLVGTPLAAIPTMTEWAMILLAVALAGGAALTIHRRRTA